MSVQVLRGKKVSVHGDGEIFVDGKKPISNNGHHLQQGIQIYQVKNNLM